MNDYPDDWLGHYNELMHKEEKQALKKQSNKQTMLRGF